MTVRGVRGATTADENSRSAILNATSELLKEIVARNDISVDDIASVLFTTTADLNAEFPAAAARPRAGEQFLGSSATGLPRASQQRRACADVRSRP